MDPHAEIHWMWAYASEAIARAERLHRHAFALLRSTDRSPAWAPPADVYFSEEAWQVTLALPGVDPGTVEIALEGHDLVVRAQRPMSWPAQASRLERLEIPYGRFERAITLPEAPAGVGSAEFTGGCLYLRLPRRREPG
jgi:HSP20 family protein